MIKLEKKYNELGGQEKTECKIWYYMHIFNWKKVATMVKKTPKNNLLHTLFLL